MKRLYALAGLALACLAAPAQDTRRSGFEDMSPATQAMQRDDALNPAMLWVQEGRALWQRAEGAAGKSCASCHGDAAQSMRGVAARYPAFDARSQGPINLAQRIGQCREQRQQASPWRAESPELLSLESYLALQSRGQPIAPPADARLAPHVQAGQALYRQRLGQLNLSCAHCHDERAGQRLGGTVIPQAHPTGYPLYRLEWQGVGSLQRRLRNCMNGVRAQLYPFNARELVQLELYLMERARGMPLESPGVRP